VYDQANVSRITSRQSPIVRRFRSLASARRPDDAVLLDGEHLIVEALDADVPIDVLLVMGEKFSETADRVRRTGATVHEVTGDVLDAASPVRTPSGLAAIARWQPRTVASVFVEAQGLVVGLVDVQEPGNVGTVIRSADALSGAAVVALDHTADPAGWKCLRGSMGSAFRVPVGRGAFADAVAAARTSGFRIIATAAGDGEPLGRATLSGRCLILLGNEGAGLADHVRSQADTTLTIPMRDGVNSLNVATTAALILWEARRR